MLFLSIFKVANSWNILSYRSFVCFIFLFSNFKQVADITMMWGRRFIIYRAISISDFSFLDKAHLLFKQFIFYTVVLLIDRMCVLSVFVINYKGFMTVS